MAMLSDVITQQHNLTKIIQLSRKKMQNYQVEPRKLNKLIQSNRKKK